jgi:(p)ppGpp synthase/HD superfamily hydrolase
MRNRMPGGDDSLGVSPSPASPPESLARSLAEQAHAGQTDRAGNPYVDHVARVAAAVRAAGGSDAQIEAAYLHDVIEDTGWTSAELHAAGIAEDAIALVALLTRTDDVPYATYLQRIRANPDALQIKRCDLADNMNPVRTALLDDATRERLGAKYAAALVVLEPTA